MTVRDYIAYKAKEQYETAIDLTANKSQSNMQNIRTAFELSAEGAIKCSHAYKSLLSILPVEALDMELYCEVTSNAE